MLGFWSNALVYFEHFIIKQFVYLHFLGRYKRQCELQLGTSLIIRRFSNPHNFFLQDEFQKYLYSQSNTMVAIYFANENMSLQLTFKQSCCFLLVFSFGYVEFVR